MDFFYARNFIAFNMKAVPKITERRRQQRGACHAPRRW